jgi:hypothetical protein
MASVPQTQQIQKLERSWLRLVRTKRTTLTDAGRLLLDEPG